jgi:hypothetical protein
MNITRIKLDPFPSAVRVVEEKSMKIPFFFVEFENNKALSLAVE